MKNKSNYFLLFGLIFSLLGCEKVPKEAVARVNDTFLYREDISDLVSKEISPLDSAVIVSNYIKNWVTEQVLLDRAKLNLPEETQKKFKALVHDYDKNLLIKAYKDALVEQNLDTLLTDEEISVFYEGHNNIFYLNENLIKLRYIHLNDSLSNFKEVKKEFKDFSKEDCKNLLDQALQFNSYSFNDSVWISEIKVYEHIKPLSAKNNETLLKKSNFMQLEDSLGVYLIFVNDVLLRNEKAPLNYVKPTIKQILLHKRKLELAKKMEQDIKNDAFKNEQIEIYN